MIAIRKHGRSGVGAALGLLCLSGLVQAESEAGLTSARVTIRGRSLQTEVAATPKARQHGLMGRRSLPEHTGMLFVFPVPEQRVCIWMKNTHVPLSVAFLDGSFRILDWIDAEPGDETPHCSPAPAQYILEVNRGWFSRNQVSPGDVVTVSYD